MQYIVASPEFWERLPYTRMLPCGRVRFTNAQQQAPTTYSCKAEAVQALAPGLQLIRETQTPSSWQYQLLITKEPQ